MATAIEKVLATPELLESILLQLPMKDLLVKAPRISQTWNTVINSSPALQQKLFFQPLPCNSKRDHECEFNPILRERFSRWFPDFADENPDIIYCHHLYPPIDWNGLDDCEDEGSDAAKERFHKKGDAYARKEASWRRMLPIQPAYKIFEVESDVRSHSGETKTIGSVEFEEGVRMGTLYDYSQKAVARPSGTFDIRWHHASQQNNTREAICKVTINTWSSTLKSGIDSDSEDGYPATENLNWPTGRDICGILYPSLGFEELDIKFKVVSHSFRSERLTEWIIANSNWSPQLSG